MTGSAISVEPWADEVSAILGSWFAGQATGDAIADVLLGKFNPGGKLSFTMARQLNDYPVHHYGEWPAKLIMDEAPRDLPPEPELRKAIHAYSGEYKEGVFVGHRWFEKNSIEPRFEFGYGLSYTTFEYGTPVLSDNSIETDGKSTVSIDVKNTGTRVGDEVVQMYVRDNYATVGRYNKMLKGFKRITLNPGESKTVSFELNSDNLSLLDKDLKKVVEPGDFTILVGASSREQDLKKCTLTVL